MGRGAKRLGIGLVGVWAMGACAGVAAAQARCVATPALDGAVAAAHSADALAARGTWFGQHGRFRCADTDLRAALMLEPRSAKLHYFLGFSLFSGGEPEAALAPLAESSRLDPRAVQPLLLRGAILQQLGRNAEAEAAWKAALRLQPGSPEALDGLCRTLLDRGEDFAVIGLLQNRADLAGSEDLTVDLASAYGSAGMLAEAEAVIRKALAVDPGSLRLAEALTTVYVHQQRYQDAVELLRRFLAENPGDQAAEIQYLGVLVLANDQHAANPLADKLFAAAPHNFDVLYLKGILEKETEAYGPARAHLQEAVQLQPENANAHYQLGATLAHLRELPAARAELEKAIALDPRQPEAHFQLAAVLREGGDEAGAQAQLALFQAMKKDGLLRTEASSKAEQARERMAAGDAVGAARLYGEAVAATPGNAMLQYQLALALDGAKDTAGERTALEKAVTLDPRFALAANQLGYLEFSSGDIAGAEQHFRQATAAAPGFADAWVDLATTLAAEGKKAEAQEALGRALALDPNNPQARTVRAKLDGAPGG